VLAHKVPQETFTDLEETDIQVDLYCHAAEVSEEDLRADSAQ
jgi:hypothetical protein